MTARAAVQSLLATDTESASAGSLGAIGVERVYAANAPDTPPERCFLVVRWDPTTVPYGLTGHARVLVWAHDKDRDYARITAALLRTRHLVTEAVHRAGADGWTLSTAEWLGESVDLFDPAFDTATRWAAFDVAARPT